MAAVVIVVNKIRFAVNNGINRSILRRARNNSREWQNVQNLIIVGCGMRPKNKHSPTLIWISIVLFEIFYYWKVLGTLLTIKDKTLHMYFLYTSW